MDTKKDVTEIVTMVHTWMQDWEPQAKQRVLLKVWTEDGSRIEVEHDRPKYESSEKYKKREKEIAAALKEGKKKYGGAMKRLADK